MSYQFFSDTELMNGGYGVEPLANLGMSSLNNELIPNLNFDNDIVYGLAPTDGFSVGEEFVYKSELTNAFLEKGSIDFSDQWEAETEASLNGWQSESALDFDNGYSNPTVAGDHIKQALLYDNYLENGYVDSLDVSNANMQATLEGPLEQMNFNMQPQFNLSPAGEFIRDAQLTDLYLEDGSFGFSDVYDANMEAYLDAPSLEYLF